MRIQFNSKKQSYENIITFSLGSHVTNTKPKGPVVFNSGIIKLKANNILMKVLPQLKKAQNWKLQTNKTL